MREGEQVYIVSARRLVWLSGNAFIPSGLGATLSGQVPLAAPYQPGKVRRRGLVCAPPGGSFLAGKISHEPQKLRPGLGREEKWGPGLGRGALHALTLLVMHLRAHEALPGAVTGG